MLKPRLDEEIARFKASRDLQHRAAPHWIQQETGTFGEEGWSISSSYKALKKTDDD